MQVQAQHLFVWGDLFRRRTALCAEETEPNEACSSILRLKEAKDTVEVGGFSAFLVGLAILPFAGRELKETVLVNEREIVKQSFLPFTPDMNANLLEAS